MKRLILIIPAVVLISLSLVACNKNSSVDTSKFTLEVVDGVKRIHNIAPQLGETPGITLELIGKIGELEGQTDKDILYDPLELGFKFFVAGEKERRNAGRRDEKTARATTQ